MKYFLKRYYFIFISFSKQIEIFCLGQHLLKPNIHIFEVFDINLESLFKLICKAISISIILIQLNYINSMYTAGHDVDDYYY